MKFSLLCESEVTVTLNYTSVAILLIHIDNVNVAVISLRNLIEMYFYILLSQCKSCKVLDIPSQNI